MAKTCKICGNPTPNNKAKYCSDECRKAAVLSDNGGWKYRAREKAVREREKSLNDKIQKAKELGISYGELVAREYINEQQR